MKSSGGTRGFIPMTPETITIARADLNAEASRGLIRALNEELSGIYSEPGATHFSLAAEEVTGGRGAFLVVYREEVPVGCGALRLLDAETAELKRMYVIPAARGTGLGRRLVTALEAEARALGVLRLVLETGVWQAAALALYRATGFHDIPLYGEYCLSPETSVCLGKELPRLSVTLSSDTALLVIDVQQGLDEPRWGARNNPDAEQRIADLLAAWRATGRPVIHVQHLSLEPQSPLRADRPGHAFKVEAQPLAGEPIFRKHVNSAFIGTDLEAHLRAHRIEALVIVGLTTDHCVSTTVRMAGNLGFAVTVVEDATATFERNGPNGAHFSADLMHRAALASLDGEFATVRSARDMLAAANV